MERIMKFLCIGALVGVLCVACGGGDEPLPPEPPPPPAISKEPQEINFYYFGDQKVEFKPLKDRVIAKAASIDEAKVLCENEIFIFEGMRWSHGEYIIASIDPETTTIYDVREVPGVLSATYGLEGDYGLMCWPTNQIFVKPVGGTSIKSVIDNAGFKEYVKEAELFNNYSGSYLITLNLNLEHILWASNEFYEKGMCEYAEPSFYREVQFGDE